jgi:hypothetical protein
MKGKKNMLNMKTVVNQILGKNMVDQLVAVLSENVSGFSMAQKQYLETMNILQAELGDAAVPSVQEEMEAVEKQTASQLLFSAYLGIKANLDNFTDPVARNFLDVDYDVYLREKAARRLPEYESAKNTRDRFYAQLSPTQRKKYEAVIAYTSHLETAGPKLAHYYGYLLGNELLPRVIPGYYPDSIQTARYTAMIQAYFGNTF